MLRNAAGAARSPGSAVWAGAQPGPTPDLAPSLIHTLSRGPESPGSEIPTATSGKGAQPVSEGGVSTTGRDSGSASGPTVFSWEQERRAQARVPSSLPTPGVHMQGAPATKQSHWPGLPGNKADTKPSPLGRQIRKGVILVWDEDKGRERAS